MQKLSGQAIEDEINPSSVCGGFEGWEKRGIPGVEDVISWNAEFFHQVLDLFIIADCDIYLGLLEVGSHMRLSIHR